MSRRIGGSVACSPTASRRDLPSLIELDKSGHSEERLQTEVMVKRKTELGRALNPLPYNDKDEDKPKQRATSLSRSLFGGLMTSTNEKT